MKEQPVRRKPTTSISFHPETLERIRVEAARRGMTVSELVDMVMRIGLKVLEEKQKETLSVVSAEKILEEYFRKVWKEDWRWTPI